MVALGVGIGLTISGRLAPVEAKSKPGTGFAAIPGNLGSEDLTGPYDVVKNWPQDISTLPGNEKWTYGAGESVFAESPNRIYMLFRGELPKMAQPKAALLPQLGPSISFPVAGFWRDATTASLPGTGGTDNDMNEWMTAWEGKSQKLGIKGPPYRQLGVDAKWENCVVVVDGSGKIIETWKQWDDKFRRPHSIYISPYDPDKNVWIVDDNMQVIYKFTHDGKKLLQTIGTPGVGAPTAPTSTARLISTGYPTALSSSPTAIPGRASRNLIRTGSFSWIGASWAAPRAVPLTHAPGTSATSTAWRSTPQRITCLSTIATIIAFRCSTKTASICMSGRLTPIRLACTCSISDPAKLFGPTTAPPTRWSSGICRAICSIPGAAWALSREASGESTA